MRSNQPTTGPIYQVHTQRDVLVPMRDGVSLATDLHRPAAEGAPLGGPFPVLLQRTPYDKSAEARALEAAFFAARGYVVAVQDCRGTHASPGSFTKYVSDGPDGYDTVEWLARQPWCLGKVGAYGLSYAAHAQAALACLNPPHLGCMWLECGGFSDAFLSGCRNGGAFELRQATWAFREALESLKTSAGSANGGISDNASGRPGNDTPPPANAALLGFQAMDRQDIFAWFNRMPWKPGHGPLQWAPDYESYLLELWSNEVYGDYWRQVGLSVSAHLAEFADVPQVHMGAWYDPYARSTTDNFVELSKGGRQSPAYLIMGPWTHGGHGVTYAGDVDLGPQSLIEGNLAQDYNHLRLSFFDRWLKGQDTVGETEAAVRIFVMGGGTGRRNPQGRLDHGGAWRVEQEWPLARANPTAFYLHPGGLLATAAPGEAAAPLDAPGEPMSARQSPPGGSAPSRYRFDPDNPTPTIGGNISSGQPIMFPGGFHQAEAPGFYGCRDPYLPLAARLDVLVFQTEPLAQGVEVTGPIAVNLWVESTAPDTDFTAKLVDVYPPSADYPEGYALNITDGIRRAKFRDSWDTPSLLEPGRIYPLTIELFPTSNLFAAGHRIRLDLSSSNFPRFDVNGNTGENPAWSTVKVAAENSIYHDANYPSHVMLPLLPPAPPGHGPP